MNSYFVQQVYISLNSFVKRIFIFPIRLYQLLVSPLFPNSCKYYPSCSQYSIESIRKFGVFKGLLKSIWRILRCNPFSHGGVDPVE